MRIYAGLYPVGLWTEPCEVICPCGYQVRAATCLDAQRIAGEHDLAHEAGTIGQLSLFEE